jgi:glycosyltransferase involved in cell wall biosynthesis
LTAPGSPPLVSVVTPFYNTRLYLSQCLESVRAQSYDHWEHILVDNVSTDGSTEIAEEYAAAEKRVRLVRNSAFLAQAENYNHALRQISADSRYCKIVEADNWIFPHCLEEMVRVAEENPSVGIVEAYHSAGRQIRLNWLAPEITFLSGRDACRFQLLHHPDQSIFGPPTSHLFRSDLVLGRDPFYDADSVLEDYEVLFELLKSNDFGFVHQVLSYVRMDNTNESITRTISDFGPYLLHALIALKRYGPFYLDEHEYEQRLKTISSRYFRLLGRGVLGRRSAPFWEYHRSGLKTIGIELTPLRLSRYALLAAAGLVLEPKRVIARIFGKKKVP